MWKCPRCGRTFANTNQNHFCGKAPETIDEYILAQDENVRDQLQSIRIVLRRTLPEAAEKICSALLLQMPSSRASLLT